MTRKLHALALGLTVAAAAVPGTAVAREDDDIFGGDPQSTVTVFKADGSTGTSAAPFGARAFVDRLLKAGASGSYETDLVGDGLTPLVATPSGVGDLDAPAGQMRFLTRSGFSSPTTKRYVMYRKGIAKSEALGRISGRVFRNADGEEVNERGWAVDVATGVIKKVSLDAAKRLSADPRKGAPNTEYVYQVFVRP